MTIEFGGLMQQQVNGASPRKRETASLRPAPEIIYEERCTQFAQQRDAFSARWSQMANLRLVLFVVVIVCAVLGYNQQQNFWYAISALSAVLFLLAVVYHYRLGLKRNRFAELWAINNEGILRLRRNWAELPLRQPRASQTKIPAFATDLDVLGPASLQHLLNTPVTEVGLATLQDWLLNPASPNEVRQRQPAISELASQIDWRDEFALRGRLLGGAQHDYNAFIEWTRRENWLLDRPWLIWFSRLFAVVTPIIAITSFVVPMLAPVALALLACAGLITWTIGSRAAAEIQSVAERQEAFRTYGELFALLSEHSFTTPTLIELQRKLSANGQQAHVQMARLGRINTLADLRLSFIYLPIQLLTLLDLHTLWLLERWRQEAGQYVEEWLKVCGEFEALAALATLRHDQPAWTFPDLSEEREPMLSALHLGHPLLADCVRVSNNIDIGPAGTMVLVTGSNMSGKSTLLRAVGLNVILAQAGAPVCAALLRLPPLVLGTSIRVQDSLSEGISYFMAELTRLKEVVDLAQASRAKNQTMLYLLDEILHGTNTGERQIAARRILRYLIDLGAIGLASTHDLALADAPELADSLQAVHFTENFTRGPDGPSMTFDYKLRQGVATSTNALKWLEIVGLGEELGSPLQTSR